MPDIGNESSPQISMCSGKANGGCVLQLLHVVEDFFLMGKNHYIDFLAHI